MLDLELWRQRFAEYITHRHFSKNSVEAYGASLKPFFDFLDQQGIDSLSLVHRQTLEDYRAHIFAKRSPNGKLWSVSTQRGRLGVVKAFFRFLFHEGYLLVDVASGLDFPRRQEVLPKVLSEAETIKLLETPDTETPAGIRDRAILEVLYCTGIRNSELCHLELCDLRLGGDFPSLHVHLGKGAKSRLVPLAQEAVQWLEIYIAQVRPRWLFRSDNTRIFLSTQGRSLERTALAIIVSSTAKKAKLGRSVTPHMLRHGCATHMLARGANLRQVQALLGHSSSTTTERYTKVEISDLAKAVHRHHPRERQ